MNARDDNKRSRRGLPPRADIRAQPTVASRIPDPAMNISVVIPVYRSARTLPALIDRLRPVLDNTGLSYEIVLVEDGSPDDSWAVLRRLQKTQPEHLVAIRLMRNFGQHNALMCGFTHARGRLIITMDDDLQNPPEEIPKLIKRIEEDEYDLVYGAYDVKKHMLWRNLGSRFIGWLYRVAFKSPVGITSFRIMRSELVRAILNYDLNYTFVDGLLAWNTQRIGSVSVDHHPRQNGRSGYSMQRLIVHAISVVTSFSLLPLQMASVVGLLAALGGLGTAAYYLLQYLVSNIAVPGYASTIIAIMVLGGIQLLSLGIIGEYLGRLHLNVNRKPQYTIRRTVGREPWAETVGERHTDTPRVAGQGGMVKSGIAHSGCANDDPT